ncbi:hypothetical protein NQ314_019684 [Rhamnusium bicolor]|uniref:Uncharacterized protein n=1 Tax=Rhamnusium bicolor TaxID=1586634 RepID=A0AAV8WMN7_9CUCU|nr:hypothetical protein NQ314_019684 [Rhamnusium bicolor]
MAGNCVKMEFCRLCQSQMGEVPIEYDQELKKKIVLVTRVEVTDDLNTYLPMFICLSCQDKIVDFYNYIETVQKVDRNLRDAVRKKHHENASNIDIIDFEDKLDDTLKCDKCPASFSDKSLMRAHINSHIITTKFKCPVCFKSYNRLTSYNSHKKSHLELYCDNCHKLFDEELERKNHKCDTGECT